MPKNTVHGGPSIEGPAEPTEDEGGEGTSPGTSSSTSPEKPKPSDEPSEAGRPQPARTTENPSAKGRAASSSARSTAGGGRKTQ